MSHWYQQNRQQLSEIVNLQIVLHVYKMIQTNVKHVTINTSLLMANAKEFVKLVNVLNAKLTILKNARLVLTTTIFQMDFA